MRILLPLFIAVALIGCSSKKQLAFNRYTVEVEYGADTGYFGAVDELTKKAEALCGKGYRKLHDYDTGQPGSKLLVWEIACKGVERENQQFTKPLKP